MVKKYISLLLIVFVFIVASTLYFFTGQVQKGRHFKKFSVVCTTGMIADAVQQICGDTVDVVALMGPGVDPHLYHARESDVHRLSAADLVLYNGLHLEGKMGSLFEKMGRTKKVYAVADGVVPEKLLASEDGANLYDPHIWFDVALWIEVVKGITDQLIRYNSDYADLYEKRSSHYRESLEKLDNYVKKTIQQIPFERRILITAHDAFNYFGRAYGIEVVGLQGISTESEVGTGDVMRLVDLIVSRDVPAIFTEASIPQRNIEAVQRAVQARGKKLIIGAELFSDTLGNPGTQGETYVGMVRYNCDSIASALCHVKKESL